MGAQMIRFLNVDVRTLLIMLSLGNIVSLSLLSVYRNKSIVWRSYLFFILSKISESAAWALLSLRGVIPDLASVYVGNVVLVIGLSLEALALISVEETKSRQEIYYATIVFSFTAVFCLLARKPNQYMYYASWFCALIFASVSVQLLQVNKVNAVRVMMSAAYFLEGVVLVFRGIYAVYDPQYRLLNNTDIQSLTFLSTFILMVISGTGFLLLNKARTDRMLEESWGELEALTRVDALTGLANRRMMEEYLSFSLQENRRRGEPIAIIMMDVDYFKNYNDRYGHVLGDRCLMAIAQEIKRHCRRITDLAVRFGGEEFLLIMWNTDQEEASLLAEEIRKGVQALAIDHAYSSAATVVTLSLGIFTAIPGEEGQEAEWYVAQADKCLYQAKARGRNRVFP
jgi:diguanylate cyclase (GGDEF)-like protein